MAKRLPTDVELLINEIVMGRCNHPDHTTETKREHGFESEYLICTKCGERLWDDDFEYKWEKKNRPRDYLKKFVPRHCEDVIASRAVVRHLESRGWTQMLRVVNGEYQCTFRNRDAVTEGSFEASEESAICSAAEKLAKTLGKVS